MATCPPKTPPVEATLFLQKKAKENMTKERARTTKENPRAREVALNDRMTLTLPLCLPLVRLHWTPPAKHARITSQTTPILTTDHNPDKPYLYCWFHGWNFSHRGSSCKRILKSGDQSRLNVANPASTTPHSWKRLRRTCRQIMVLRVRGRRATTSFRARTRTLTPSPQQSEGDN
jgi:hypothetical protein